MVKWTWKEIKRICNKSSQRSTNRELIMNSISWRQVLSFPQIQQLNVKLRAQDMVGRAPQGLLKEFRQGMLPGIEDALHWSGGNAILRDDLCFARAYDQDMSGAIKAQSMSVCVRNLTADCSSSLEIKPPLNKELFFFLLLFLKCTPDGSWGKNMQPNIGEQTRVGAAPVLSPQPPSPCSFGGAPLLFCPLSFTTWPCPRKAQSQPLRSSTVHSNILKWIRRNEKENLI